MFLVRRALPRSVTASKALLTPAVCTAWLNTHVNHFHKRPAALPALRIPSTGYRFVLPTTSSHYHQTIRKMTCLRSADEAGVAASGGSSVLLPHDIQILYGTQTGTAMTFAHELRKMAKKRKLKAKVHDLAKFDKELLFQDKINVLVMACFGHGEPTANASDFYYWLMSPERDAEKEKFAQVKYAMFGLGQSQHYPERYQAVGKNVDKRMEQLGATRCVVRGEGDDSGDIEEDFELWVEKLWNTIEKDEIAPEAKVSVLDMKVPQPPDHDAKAEEMVCGTRQAASSEEQGIEKDVYNVQRPYDATIIKNEEMHNPSSARSCRHIVFSIDPEKTPYTSGDYIGVFPRNRAKRVYEICDRLEMSPEARIDVRSHPILNHVKADTVSLFKALEKYYDIAAPPRRSVLKGLAEFAEGEEQKKLQFLSSRSPIANTEYNSWVVGMQLNMIEILQAFPSINIKSADAFVDLLSPLTPRFYSICSSPVISPDEIHIAASVVKYRTPLNRVHKGVCTSFLSECRVGKVIPVFVKESLFRLPENPETPIIMVGAGTGVAPFRAFIQERIAKSTSVRVPGENVLFYGCNFKEVDFLFRDEFESAVSDGHLTLKCAFAFHQPWWQFVQHRIIEPENAEMVWDLLSKKGAYIYVCGDSKNMAPAVHEAFLEVIQKQGNMSYQEASDFLQDLKFKNHYQLDVF